VRFSVAEDVVTALREAHEQKRELIVYISSPTCGVCKTLEKRGFQDASVAQALDGYLVLHVTGDVPAGAAIERSFHVNEYPTLIVLSPDGVEMDRVVGYSVPAVLVRDMGRIQAGTDTLPALRRRTAAGDGIARRVLVEKLVKAAPTAAVEMTTAMLSDAAAPLVPWLLLQRGLAHIRAENFDLGAADFLRILQDWSTGEEASVVADIGLLQLSDGPIETVLPVLAAARSRLSRREDRRAVEENAVLVLRREIGRCMDRRVADAEGDAAALAAIVDDCTALRVRLQDAVKWARSAVAQQRTYATLFSLAKAVSFDPDGLDEAIQLAREASVLLREGGRRSRELETCLIEWSARRAAKEGPDGSIPPTNAGDSQK
jgi:hypothetical protein